MKYFLEMRNGIRAVVDGKDTVLFSTNDYLSLSCHPDVEQAVVEAFHRYGSGSGGAPGTTGTTSIHLELSKAAADFKSRENAVLLPSGYQANIALHHALGSDDTIFFLDKRHHPSAADGARLVKDYQVIRFDHRDLDGFESLLKTKRSPKQVVSIPSVFTIDGDIAPLNRLVALKDKYRFILVLDEAHASGCLGATGRGLEEHFGLKGTADFVMGTFSKAFGASGGFVAFDDDRKSYLKSSFRQFDYSTSLSPIIAAAALKALQLLTGPSGLINGLRRSKQLLAMKCREHGIDIIMRDSMIMPLLCGDPDMIQEKMLADGFLVMPSEAEADGIIRPCIRLTANAAHTEDDIERFARALREILRG